jgi:hypothetical protein
MQNYPLKICKLGPNFPWRLLRLSQAFQWYLAYQCKPENSVFIGSWQSVRQCLFCVWHLGFTVWHVMDYSSKNLWLVPDNMSRRNRLVPDKSQFGAWPWQCPCPPPYSQACNVGQPIKTLSHFPDKRLVLSEWLTFVLSYAQILLTRTLEIRLILNFLTEISIIEGN